MSRKGGFYNRLTGRHVGLIISLLTCCNTTIFQLGPKMAPANSYDLALGSPSVGSSVIWAFADGTIIRNQDFGYHIPAASAAALTDKMVQGEDPCLLVRSCTAVGMAARLVPARCLAGVLSFTDSFCSCRRDTKGRIHVPDGNPADWLEKSA